MVASNYLTNAINVKSYNLSESDKIVVMYSKEKGLIRGVAKGSKNTKSKLGGRMDLLVANKLMLFKGKNLDRICQAEALNTFNSLRADMDKMIYSSYMSEIITNFGVENDPNSGEVYDIFYGALSQMASAASIIEVLLCVMRFQLKMMKVCGYELQLTHCINCGCEFGSGSGDVILSVEKGGVRCMNCACLQGGGGVKFYSKLREFLAHLCASDFDVKTDFERKADEKVSRYCFSILKSYVELHSPRAFKTAKMLAGV